MSPSRLLDGGNLYQGLIQQNQDTPLNDSADIEARSNRSLARLGIG